MEQAIKKAIGAGYLISGRNYIPDTALGESGRLLENYQYI